MPQPTRQRPSTPTTSSSVPAPALVTAANGETNQPGLRICIYGVSKVGKTRLVSTFPKPILLVGQDGTKSIATGKTVKAKTPSGNQVFTLTLADRPLGIDFIRLSHSKHFDEALALAVRGDYKTVALDTARDLHDLHTKEVLQLDRVPATRAFGMANQSTWGSINQLTIDHLFRLFELNEKHGLSTPVIAHERSFKEEGVSSEIIKPTIGADLSPGVKRFLDGACDFIVQAYIGEQKERIKLDDDVGFIEQPTGKFEYRLRIGRHSVYTVGFRSVADELPDHIVNPSYQKIVAVIEGRTV